MKKVFFFLLLSVTVLFMSCGDNESSDPVDFMTATINGNGFEASIVTGFSDTTFGEEIILIIGKQNSNGNTIGLNIASSLGTGANEVTADSPAITFTEDLDNGTAAFFTVGTLTITKNDLTENIIEGSFNFTATDEDDELNIFNVTNGQFKVAYR